MAEEQIINFSEPKQMALFLAQTRLRKGPHRVSICKHRNRRSDRQNRYYHPCFVEVFADFLNGQGESYTHDEVHQMFRFKFLRKTGINPLTGEYLSDFTRSTTDLTTVEFNEYLDKIAAWLATFGIRVPEPGDYREPVLETIGEIEW